MYQRSYPYPDNLPPNYQGTAFNRRAPINSGDGESAVCINGTQDNKEKIHKEGLPSLPINTEGDDILLSALIIMLLQGHCEDELLIILLLLLLI